VREGIGRSVASLGRCERKEDGVRFGQGGAAPRRSRERCLARVTGGLLPSLPHYSVVACTHNPPLLLFTTRSPTPSKELMKMTTTAAKKVAKNKKDKSGARANVKAAT
jgi:hypothetical protein